MASIRRYDRLLARFSLIQKAPLTLDLLCAEAADFAEVEAKYDEPALFGVTDGKAVGTYLEHKFTS